MEQEINMLEKLQKFAEENDLKIKFYEEDILNYDSKIPPSEIGICYTIKLSKI